MATLELDGVSKSFGAVDVVHGIDLEVADREFVVLVGPSGCGKSTILRMVAGLEEITAGEVRIDGRRVNESPSRHRNLAMVFQDYALYPHMTVAANLGFGLKMNNVPAAERAARVREIAALLQLEPYLARKPRALSGGQRQRVAMGRALARKAQLFLFDEPLSNLDAKLRIDVRTQIKLLHQELGMTSIFVTHDQTEAMTLADRIVCLEDGRIAQIGTPEELYNHPVTVFVASFIGSPQINLLPGEIGAEAGAPVLVLEDGQRMRLPPERVGSLTSGQRVLAGLRPEDLTDHSRLQSLASPGELVFDTLVVETLGSDVFLVGTIAGAPVSSRCAPGMRAVSGERLTLHADASRLHFFDPTSRRRI